MRRFRMSYETILNTAIRPPRNEFSPEELGPKRFELEGRQYERTDYTVSESASRSFGLENV